MDGAGSRSASAAPPAPATASELRLRALHCSVLTRSASACRPMQQPHSFEQRSHLLLSPVAQARRPSLLLSRALRTQLSPQIPARSRPFFLLPDSFSTPIMSADGDGTTWDCDKSDNATQLAATVVRRLLPAIGRSTHPPRSTAPYLPVLLSDARSSTRSTI